MGALKGTCKIKPEKGKMWVKDRYVTLLPKGVKLGNAIKTTTESITSMIREGRVEDAQRKYPLTPEIWQTILRDQPSDSNNKFLMWIGKVVAATDPNSWVNNANRALQTVRAFAQSMPGKDIYQFPSIDAAIEANDAQEPKPVSKKAKVRADLPIVYQDENWKVFEPKTHEAMQKVGGGTSWCVATSNSAHWKSYYRNGSFLVVKAKKDIEFRSKEGPLNAEDEIHEIDDLVAAGERFAIYIRAGSVRPEVYNKEDTNIGFDEFASGCAKNDEGLLDFIHDWIGNVDEEVYAREQEMDDEMITDYLATDESWKDFLETYLYSEFDTTEWWDRGEAKIKLSQLSEPDQELLRTSVSYTAEVDRQNGEPDATIGADRFHEYIKSELPKEDRPRLARIVSYLTGLDDIVGSVPDAAAHGFSQKYRPGKKEHGTYDEIIAQAQQNIRSRDDIETTRARPWVKPTEDTPAQGYLPLGVRPADNHAVNKASVKKELIRMGYDDIAAAMESIDVQSDQLIAIVLEGL